MEKREIIVITTLINGTNNFIANQMTTSEGGRWKVVNYCRNPALAKEFKSEEEANQFIPQIKNPHERIFTVGTAFVNVKERESLLQMAREEQLV